LPTGGRGTGRRSRSSPSTREACTWRRGPASQQGGHWNARRPPVNTDDSELVLFRAERRVREIQTKLHRWAREDPHRRFDDLFVVAFMALDAVGFSSRLARVRRQRADVVGALDSFVHGTRRYLLVSTVFGLIVAAIDTGFLWLIGVPLPLLWGLLAFITNYIPNVGFIIGLIPPAVLALLQGGPKLMITVIVAYSLINFIIQSIIQPKVTADPSVSR
jgi:hypothetical protein